LFINGLAADVMFFRGSLDKLGIYPDMYQIGKYKSAGDTFRARTCLTRTRIHEFAARRSFQSLRRFDRERSRQTSDEIRAIIDDAPYGAAKAKEVGLIDGVAYRDELEKELKTKLGYKESDQLRVVKSYDYQQVEPESLGLDEGEKIAVIYATGDIVPDI